MSVGFTLEYGNTLYVEIKEDDIDDNNDDADEDDGIDDCGDTYADGDDNDDSICGGDDDMKLHADFTIVNENEKTKTHFIY